nr:hypothetical protein [Candidatus Liberibacter asiaticus]
TIFFYYCFFKECFIYLFIKKMLDCKSIRQVLTIKKYATKELVDALARQKQNLEASFDRLF